MGENEAVFVDLLQKWTSQRDVLPRGRMYKRIRDGLNRWMKIIEASLRDEFRGGWGSLRFGQIYWKCIRGWLETGELEDIFNS